MKKRLFLAFFISAVLFCMLALVANAETIISQDNLDENGDIVAKIEYKVDDNHYYHSVDITYLNNNGETKTGKFYYFSDGWWYDQLQISSAYIPKDFDFSQTVYLFDKVDFNGNGIYEGTSDLLKGTNGGGKSSNPSMKWYTYGSFDSATGTFTDAELNARNQIETLSYSKYMTYFGNTFFCVSTSLKTVTYNGKAPVEGTIFISPSVKEIMADTFGGDGSSLTQNNVTPPYKRIVFEARDGSLKFGQYAFCRGCVEEVVFLKGTYYLNNKEAIALQFIAGTSTPSLKSIVVEDGVTFGSGEISWQMDQYDIRFIGEEANYSYDNYSSCLKNASGTVIYEELCYVYGHEAEAEDNDCTTALGCIYKADGCDYIYTEALEHMLGKVYSYENGYLSVGTLKVGCTNEGCEHGEKSEIPALATSKGYSQDSTSNAIVLDITYNRDAISAYEKYLNTEIKFGLVASYAFDDNSPLKLDGTAKQTAIGFDITEAQYSIYQLKLTNIDKKDAALHCSGYIAFNNTVTYINGQKTDTTAIRVSYNNYTGIPEAKEEEVA